MSSRSYAWAAAALFALEAAAAIVRRATGGVYPGYTVEFSVFIDAFVAVAWVAAAVAGLIHRSWPAFVVMFAGCLTALTYGVLVTEASRAVGVPFVLAAGAQLFCVVHASRAFLGPEDGSPERAPRSPRLAAMLHRLRLRHSP